MNRLHYKDARTNPSTDRDKMREEVYKLVRQRTVGHQNAENCTKELLDLMDKEMEKARGQGKQQVVDYLDKVLHLTIVNKMEGPFWVLTRIDWDEIKRDIPLTDRSTFARLIIEEAKKQERERILNSVEFIKDYGDGEYACIPLSKLASPEGKR